MKTRRLLAGLAAAVVTLAGCSSDITQAPLAAPEAPAAVLGGSIDLTGVLTFAGAPSLAEPRHAEKFIRAAEGGSVELQGFRVDIPAGALPRDMTITIDLPADQVLAKRVLAEFGPHGTQFNTPVTLSFPLVNALLGGGPLAVARWEGDAWTQLPSWLSTDGTRLYGTTPHFSTYAARGYTMGGG
ncbi:MAG TPA: hypothetical protein VF746_30490 [Longimicrobium sp.]